MKCFSDDELRELEYAAWLHDVGKVTTPVWVMDKATKLETIFDRIELIEIGVYFIWKVLYKERTNAQLSLQSFLSNNNAGFHHVYNLDMQLLNSSAISSINLAN